MCMRTSASEHVNKTLSGHHALRVSILDCRRNGVRWDGVRITQGRVGLSERLLMQAVGCVGLCRREGRGAAVCTQARGKGGERQCRTACRAPRCWKGDAGRLFLTVYTTRFGSAKS